LEVGSRLYSWGNITVDRKIVAEDIAGSIEISGNLFFLNKNEN